MLKDQSRSGTQSDLSGRPRFLQIADEIRASVENKTLKVHDILPSERILSEQYGVSRMTARRAMEALETEGLVYSADRRGRFVSPARLEYNVSNMISFVSTAQSNDVDLKIDLVNAFETTADARVAALLEQPEGCGITQYTRLFHTGAHPTFIETEYLISAHFPDFLKHDLRRSTTKILKENYGVSAATGDIVIRMRRVHTNEADLLSIATSNTVIELEQVIRDEAGVPFCFGCQVWRGEMAEFSAHAIVNDNVRAMYEGDVRR